MKYSDHQRVKKIYEYSGFLFIDKDGMPLVAMHWS